MVTLKKLTEVVNHIVNEKIEIEEISPDTKIEFQVETDVDRGTLEGGCYFNDLTKAYNYLKEILEFGLDFDKIDSVSLYLFFDEGDLGEIQLAYYSRINETEFDETLL